jgi:hypothetical protein
MNLQLPSGPSLSNCRDRLLRFFPNEYAYYDAIPTNDPNRIEPLDILVTVPMNSRVDTGEKVQKVHRGMAAACDPLLPRIPVDADILIFDPDLEVGESLLSAAISVPGVLSAVATKVLHRKRRNYIPMLDSVVVLFYLDALHLKSTQGRLQDKTKAAQATMPAWRAFREDLRANLTEIKALRDDLVKGGYVVTPVRILEVLIWMEAESRGYYREAKAQGLPTNPRLGSVGSSPKKNS